MKDEQAAEQGEDRPVIDGRHLDLSARRLGDDRRASTGPALEEGIAVRVEEIALARWDVEVAMLHTQVDRTAERDDVAPRAEAIVHRVGEVSVVALQPLEEPEQAHALRVERVIDGEQAPVLCIEDEHQPKHDGEQPAVEVVFIALEGLAQKPALVALCRRLKTLEECLQAAEDLLGQILGHRSLVLATAPQERRQGVLVAHAKPLIGAEQHDHRIENRAPADRGHIIDPKGDVAGGLAVRRVDQTNHLAIRQDPDGHAAVPEQAIELGGGGIGPAAGGGLGLVERKADGVGRSFRLRSR